MKQFPGFTDFLLIDDYDTVFPVKEAVDEFLDKHSDEFVSVEHRKTLRGDIVIHVK